MQTMSGPVDEDYEQPRTENEESDYSDYSD
jgi:hypothetical protein